MPVGVNLRQIVVPAGSPSVPATAIVAAIEKATADTQAIADASAGSATAASASATAAAASATAAATSETNAAASAAQAEAAAQTVTGTVHESRQINTGTGLTGGGDLTADRTLAADFGTTAGTVAEGDDARIVGAAQKAANLSDLADAPTARDNLGLGTAAVADEAFLLDRANHTGVQDAVTISDFNAAVLAIAAGWLPSDTLANQPAPSAAIDRHLFYAYDTNQLFICIDNGNDGVYEWQEAGSGAQAFVQTTDPLLDDPTLEDGTIWFDSDEPDANWNFDASAVTSGTFDPARIPNIPLRIVRSGKDLNGIFVTIEYYRVGGNLFKKSVLSGGASPSYTTRTETYYDTDGVTVLQTVVYTLTYDTDGDLTAETAA